MILAEFTGRAGADAELKFSPNGTPFAAFTVAVDTGKGPDGRPVTEWIRCSFFGAGAADLAPQIGKGDEVEVSGKLTVGRWTAADGTARAGLNCLASYVNSKSKQRGVPPKGRDAVSRAGFAPRRQTGPVHYPAYPAAVTAPAHTVERDGDAPPW